MFKKLTNEEFLEKLQCLGIKYIPLEEYKGAHVKIKWLCYENQNHVFEAEPCDIYSGKTKCPYCAHRLVFVGETDMWSTRPDMAKMLKNPDDGYKYFTTSSHKVDWICPNCHSDIKDKIINNVNMFGLSCPNCSDGMSFGEKYVYELLTQLKCNFIYDKTTEWSNNKRYDFRIPSMNLIIEVHGIQHYEQSFMEYHNSKRNVRTIEEEKQNDNYKMNLALSNGIKYYIQLDCKLSDYDYIKSSIIDSKLNELFDLSIVNWDKCFESTFSSNVILCADLWNSGMKNTKDISNNIGFNITSVIKYLKQAAKIGLCDYELNYTKNSVANKNLEIVCTLWENGVRNVTDLMKESGLSNGTVYKMLKRANLSTVPKNTKQLKPKQRKSKTKYLCLETNKIYNTYSELRNSGFNPKAVSNCCSGLSETSSGLHWKTISE